MNERIWLQVQASEMRFLQKIERVILFDKVRSSETWKSLNIELLLIRIERSQLKWFGHVSRMPLERFPKQALFVKIKGKRLVKQPHNTLGILHWGSWMELLGASTMQNVIRTLTDISMSIQNPKYMSTQNTLMQNKQIH